jgi:O-antigen ligase
LDFWVALMLLAIPFNFGARESFLIIPISEIILFILIFAYLLQKHPSQKFEWPGPKLPLILLSLYLLFAILSSSFALDSFRSFEILRLELESILFFLLAVCIIEERNLKFFLNIITLALAIEIIVAFSLYYFSHISALTFYEDSMVIRDAARRLRGKYCLGGTFGQKNILGSYLILVLPLVWSLFLIAVSKFKKIIYLSVLMGGVLLLIFSESIGAWIGMGVTLLIFLLLLRNKLKITSLILPLVFIFILTILFREGIFIRIRNFISFQGQSYGTAVARLFAWKEALKLIKLHPFLGIGNHMFRYYAKPHVHVHNLYLGKIVEFGIIAGSIFVFLLVYFLKKGFTALRYKISGNNRIFLISLLGGMCGFLIREFFDYTYSFGQIHLLFWFLAAILIKVSEISSDVTADKKEPKEA